MACYAKPARILSESEALRFPDDFCGNRQDCRFPHNFAAPPFWLGEVRKCPLQGSSLGRTAGRRHSVREWSWRFWPNGGTEGLEERISLANAAYKWLS